MRRSSWRRLTRLPALAAGTRLAATGLAATGLVATGLAATGLAAMGLTAAGGPAAAAVSPAVMPGDSAVGMAPTLSGHGYWIVTRSGDVLPFGDARSYGSLHGVRLAAGVVGVSTTPDARGYWLAAADGGVFAFGDARFYGSASGIRLDAPVVGLAATGDGHGYWLAAADGGVFAFGDAGYGGGYNGALAPVDRAVTAIASLPVGAPPDDRHYMMATAGGNVAGFGFTGGSFPGGYLNTSRVPLAAPMVSLAWAGGFGYWTAAGDGGVFALGAPVSAGSGMYSGQTPFYGSMGGRHLAAPVVAMAATPDRRGYWLLGGDGGVFSFGDAQYSGSASP